MALSPWIGSLQQPYIPLRVPSLEQTESSYKHEISKLETKISERIALIQAYQGIQKTDIWKLVFMERDRLTEGKDAYEKEEPGYLRGILKGYLKMLETLGEELSSDLFVQLHDSNVDGVTVPDSYPEGVPKGFRHFEDGGESFFLIEAGEIPTLSKQGYQELNDRYKKYKFTYEGEDYFPLKAAMVNPKNTIALGVKTAPSIKLKPTRPETCRLNFIFLMSLYHQAPKHTAEEKIRAIIRLCQDLDQFHTFVDGNIRTTGIITLNKLLIENSLSPAVLRDVNQLDCLSEDELIDIVKEGQVYFQALKHVIAP